MANKKFKDNNTLDSSQVYDASTNSILGNVLKCGLFGQYGGNDLNSCIAAGVYNFTPDTLNKPINYAYGAVLVIVSSGWVHNNDDNWVWQICFTTSQLMYMRQKINNNSWSSWKQII